MQRRVVTLLVVIGAPVMGSIGHQASGSVEGDERREPVIVRMEFIFEEAPHAQCHASTIAEVEGGLVAAWFGGTREKHPDVGIWLSRNEGKGWSQPVEVANGVVSPEERYPCWNPVLFQPREGPLMLFYKVGPSPSEWWGRLMTSGDGGKTWSPSRRLPDGILGPIKNKPLQRDDSVLLCPSSTEHAGWRVHFELTSDLGRTWKKVGPINDGKAFGAIQPTLLTHPDGRIQALCRSRQGRITQAWSTDGGESWGPMTASELPNPSAGIDAVTLDDGRHLLVYNHTSTPEGRRGGSRSFLNVAASGDGRDWKAALVLEDQPGEYSYPAVIQTSDRLVHLTYTYQRRKIKHVVLDPRNLTLRDMPDGEWPGP